MIPVSVPYAEQICVYVVVMQCRNMVSEAARDSIRLQKIKRLAVCSGIRHEFECLDVIEETLVSFLKNFIDGGHIPQWSQGRDICHGTCLRCRQRTRSRFA